mgnify:CR=1 FL=1
MSVVHAKFDRHNVEYTYLVPNADKPSVGDYILTSYSPDRCEALSDDDDDDVALPGGLRMARIVRVGGKVTTKRPLKPYLLLLTDEYLSGLRVEQQKMAEVLHRRREARETLRAMLTEDNELIMFEKLAEKNPEAAKLLDLLK